MILVAGAIVKDLLFYLLIFQNAVDYPHRDLSMMHVSDMLREVQKQLVQRRKVQGYIVLLSVVLHDTFLPR